jgi:hypothetical protein
MDELRTEQGNIEAYLFERHIDAGGIDGIKTGLANAPGVAFVAQFVGAFNLFARVVARQPAVLQSRIAGEYFEAGVRSDWSINLTGSRIQAPKRGSPPFCGLVCAQTTVDPFGLLPALDAQFGHLGDAYGAAVVTSRDFDVLVELSGGGIEEVIELIKQLREVPGIGRTSTSLADLTDNAIRPPESSAQPA